MKQWLRYFSKLIFRNGMRLVLGGMILFSAGCAGAPVTEVVETPMPSASPENPTRTVPVARRDYRDQTYCTIDNVDLLYDLSYPDDVSAEPLPMVVYVHGGAWKMGDRRGGAGAHSRRRCWRPDMSMPPSITDWHLIISSRPRSKM